MSVTTKRRQFTLADKIAMLNKVKDGARKSDVCKEYGIASSTLSTILKNQDKILHTGGVDPSKRKRLKTTDMEDLDVALLQWFRYHRAANVPISGPILKEKATSLGRSLEYGEDFNCSMSWINRFKERHSITAGKITGEAKSVNREVTDAWIKNEFPKIVENYKPSDVYNADETGLFFKLMPDKTLKFKNEKCTGGKLSKERITVLLCANSDGSEKRRPLVVGRTNKPRCFKNVKSLPVKYVANKKAWMTGDIFSQELEEWDRELIRRKRTIVLIVDNCAAHPRLTTLQNIKLVFLPPNTTSVLQPLDQGIINSFKFHFRKLLVMKTIENMENQATNTSINVLEAIRYLDRAWKNVTQTTIQNCFKHAGFVIGNAGAEENSDNAEDNPEKFDEEDEIPLGELARIVNLGNLPDIMDYVNVDNCLVTSEIPTDAEIVAAASTSSGATELESTIAESDSDSDCSVNSTTSVNVSLTEAMKSVQNLRKFFESKANIEYSTFGLLSKLENVIDSVAKRDKRQLKITEFMCVSKMSGGPHGSAME